MNPSFTDQITLAEQAENLGRMALTMGLMLSFVVATLRISRSRKQKHC
jgi:hypothetical protein